MLNLYLTLLSVINATILAFGGSQDILKSLTSLVRNDKTCSKLLSMNQGSYMYTY